MTGEFSRRSFLKYTALTAVAVAGSSLLTGCSGYAPVQHAPGTSNTVLKVVSTLDWVEYDEETNTTLFRLVVTNGRKNALEVTKANFAVKADGYLADQNNKLEVTSPDALSYQVKQGETVTYHVMAKGLNALTDGPVTLTFYPTCSILSSTPTGNWPQRFWNRISPTPLRPDLPGRKNILVNNGGISHVLYIFPPRIPEVFGSHRSGCGRCQSAGRL